VTPVFTGAGDVARMRAAPRLATPPREGAAPCSRLWGLRTASPARGAFPARDFRCAGVRFRVVAGLGATVLLLGRPAAASNEGMSPGSDS
jgi:hypothetical protein